MNPRSPYLVSSLGHLTVLAAALALSFVQRPPAIVPNVRIVALAGGARVQAPPRPAPKVEAAPRPAPAKVEAPPPEPKKPEPKKKESESPPERKAATAPEKSGTQPPQKRDIVSKTTGTPKAAPVPSTGPAPASAPPGGAPGAGVGFETDADPGPLGPYLTLLRDKVANAWAAPVTAGRKGEVRAVVFFVIERGGGAPQQLAVQMSSGDPGFDRAAMRAILNAAPLAPLPASWGTDSIGIRFTFFQDY